MPGRSRIVVGPLPPCAYMPPVYVPGMRMHGSWFLHVPEPVVDSSLAGRFAPTVWSGVSNPDSGSASRGRKCWVGVGLIWPSVFAAYSPPMRISAPLMKFIWNDAFSAFTAPLLLSASVHFESTMTFFSNVSVMPPFTRNEAQPLRCAGQLRFEGSRRMTA